jgi:hypothetical protein
VGLASREVSRVEWEVELSDARARHGTNEPPSATAPKFGGCHGNGGV